FKDLAEECPELFLADVVPSKATIKRSPLMVGSLVLIPGPQQVGRSRESGRKWGFRRHGEL
ncbi:MAG: hypothetical protein NTU62_11200, partial [Spirochaetes bacterium]|nr:hypothetical protein [Spirochaetota bacterium]